MRVSELVTIDEINTWNDGDIITITAGTGMGKSYFIKNNLYAIAKRDNKKILMLVHRLNCLDQFQYEIQRDNKIDIITLGTYQSIEHSSLKGVKSNRINPNDYDYVICDEFHYFMSDASFNKTTDLSLQAILQAEDSVRIFMSATGDYVERYMGYKGYEIRPYRLPINFSFIRSLTFYNKDETLEYYIQKAIKGNYKTIVFINDVKLAGELYKKYEKHSMFNCSKSNKEYELVDENKVDVMLKNEKFEDLILFTTTVMDTGVNIYDDKIQNIICHNILDVRVLTQCIGRIRFKNNKQRIDSINVVINSFTNQQLGGYTTKYNREIKHADYLLKHGTTKYNDKFYRKSDVSNIVYDDTTISTSETDEVIKKVNELAYFKRRIDANEIELMLKEGKDGYCKYLKKWFGFNKRYILEEEKKQRDRLEDYLDEMVGTVILQTKDRKGLIETINVRQNGRLLKGLNSLNTALEESGYNYRINKFETSRTINGKRKNFKSAWRVLRLIDK